MYIFQKYLFSFLPKRSSMVDQIIFQDGKSISFRHFIFLTAMLGATGALAIDSALPALLDISTAFNLGNSNDVQLVVSSFFLGIGLSSIFWGPFCDRFGRKTTLYVGLSINTTAAFLCAQAQSFEMLIFWRFVHGFGASSIRIANLSMARDLFGGAKLSQALSLMMTIFILVPICAPLLGQIVLEAGTWRDIFYLSVVFAFVNLLWTHKALSETLKPEYIHPFHLMAITKGYKEIIKHPVALGYTMAFGLSFSGFMAYLAGIKPIAQEVFGLQEGFVLLFAINSSFFGIASFINAKIVKRFGIKKISFMALALGTLTGIVHLMVIWIFNIHYLAIFVPLVCVYFVCVGFFMANLITLALSPMKHIAGSATAFVSLLSTLVSVGGSIIIGQFYHQTEIPLIVGIMLSCFTALAVMCCVESFMKKERSLKL